MEVIIHTHNNITINLEISFFDAISDIKHQFQSLFGISTSRQSVYYNNTLLPDNLTIQNSTILNNSHLNLIVQITPHSRRNNVSSLLVQSPLTNRYATLPGSKNKLSDIKQTISDKEQIPVNLIAVFYRGIELDDDEMEIKDDDAVIETSFVGTGGLYKFVENDGWWHKSNNFSVKIVVFVVNSNVKFPMTLALFQRFSDLRRELEKLRKKSRISLPDEWFFVYVKERVLIECMPFNKFKIHNGDVLQVWSTVKMHQNTPETPPSAINVEETSPTTSPNAIIRLKMPTPISPISVEMSPNATFSKLKDKIHDMEHVPKSRISHNLNDQTSFRELDGVISVMKNSPTTSVGSGSANHGPSKRLKIMVLYKNGTERIPVEMNIGDTVCELRKELEKMQERMGFELPAEGYFFIYKQNVMDDDKSFGWHKVGQGDVIEVFSGSVTGGS